jgi:diamine N-acetyltransferase
VTRNMEKKNLKISARELMQADIPAVQDITRRSWLAAYSRFIPESDLLSYFNEHYSSTALTAFFSDPDSSGFIAEADSAAAGYCKTQFNRQEGRLYIPSLYILPEYQAAGIGTLLLERAQSVAQAYGLHEVWLGVMVENMGALAWYRSRGFQFVREEPFTMGATTIAHLIGFKRID